MPSAPRQKCRATQRALGGSPRLGYTARCAIGRNVEGHAKGIIVATLKPDTFGSETYLLKRVRNALTNLTGIAANRAEEYVPAPIKLSADRDLLDPDYKVIWKQCTIEYDPNEAGAEIYLKDRKIVLGPFMKGFSVMELEKVILHEFLHAALDDGWQRLSEQAQHGQINLIIGYNIGYPPPPNPANPSED